MVDVPFAIGEEFSSKWAFLPYIERGLTNFARVDVCNVGGLTEAMKVAGWAEAHYIDLMPHNPLGPICTAATIHLAAAVPNFAWLEVRTSPTEELGFDDSELFPVQPRLEGSALPGARCAGAGGRVQRGRWPASSPSSSGKRRTCTGAMAVTRTGREGAFCPRAGQGDDRRLSDRGRARRESNGLRSGRRKGDTVAAALGTILPPEQSAKARDLRIESCYRLHIQRNPRRPCPVSLTPDVEVVIGGGLDGRVGGAPG